MFIDRRRDGAVRGVISYGSQLVLAADDPRALDAFAVETRTHPGLRSFVGPKRAVDGLWSRVRTWHVAPDLIRDRQPLYALYPSALPSFDDVEVRRATPSDVGLVAENSALMILGELGYDPRAHRTSFTAQIRRAIDLGQWWVWRVGDELRFQCNVGAKTPVTAQIQGVWTPPAQRGHGYATLALAAISERLLLESPTLSLYVNDFNDAAIALYERLGYTLVGELATLLFA